MANGRFKKGEPSKGVTYKVGHIPWLKGKHLTDDHKEKLKQAKLKNPTRYWLGKERKGLFSLEQRKKIGEYSKGEKSIWWKGGVSKINKTERRLAMETIEYKMWREEVFKRDNYTCVLCGIRGNQTGGKLNADHIKSWAKYPELRLELTNGRTLCVPCHRKTDTYGGKK